MVEHANVILWTKVLVIRNNSSRVIAFGGRRIGHRRANECIIQIERPHAVSSIDRLPSYGGWLVRAFLWCGRYSFKQMRFPMRLGLDSSPLRGPMKLSSMRALRPFKMLVGEPQRFAPALGYFERAASSKTLSMLRRAAMNAVSIRRRPEGRRSVGRSMQECDGRKGAHP